MKIIVAIEHLGKIILPVIKEGVSFTTEWRGMPGKLTFSAYIDDALKFDEGDRVKLYIDGETVFLGRIFSHRIEDERFYYITAYDNLRYLTNRDTYSYVNKRASDVVKMVFGDLNFPLGDIQETEYVIPSRIEENKSLWDIINTALDLERDNKGNTFILYDNVGKINLKKNLDLAVDLMICDAAAEGVDYSVSIDGNTYNVVKTVFANRKEGSYQSFIADDKETVAKWGKLQYYDTLIPEEDGNVKAAQLLARLNKPSKSFYVKNCFGHIEVRGGSVVFVNLNVGNEKICDFMTVESCSHLFLNEDHKMSLQLRGGGYGL